MPVSPCNEIPQEVDSGTGSAGTLATYSRCDHKHVLANLGVATAKIADLMVTNAKIANSTVDLTTKATYVPVNKAGDTMSGDLTIGANRLKTTDLLLKQWDVNQLSVRDGADAAFKDLICQNLNPQGDISLLSGKTVDGVDVSAHTHTGAAGQGQQIPTAGLADGAVTTAKIAASAVTGAKVATGTLSLSKRRALGKNKVWNPGYEYFDALKDTWMLETGAYRNYAWDGWVAMKDTSADIDSYTADKLKGERSIRLIAPYGSMLCRLDISYMPIDNTKDYLFSFYGKVLNTNTTDPIYIEIVDDQFNPVFSGFRTMTTSWARYTASVPSSAWSPGAKSCKVMMQTYNISAAIDWLLDCCQFEQGTSATDFEEALFLLPEGVTTALLAEGAVTNAKIANSTIDLTAKATYVPVNKAGDTLSGNLDFAQNQALQLVLHKGTTFPASPVAGQLFYRTDEDKVYKYDGTQWEELGAAGGAPTTASYVTIADETASLPNSIRHVNIPEDQKHTPKAHTLASHSSKDHDELTGVGANDHHSSTSDGLAITPASVSVSGDADVAGKVGIGTISPGSTMGSYNVHTRLDIVSSSTQGWLRLASGVTGEDVTAIWLHPFDFTNAGWMLGTNNVGKLRLGYGSGASEEGAVTNAKDGSSGITIDSSGNVTIGTKLKLLDEGRAILGTDDATSTKIDVNPVFRAEGAIKAQLGGTSSTDRKNLPSPTRAVGVSGFYVEGGTLDAIHVEGNCWQNEPYEVGAFIGQITAHGNAGVTMNHQRAVLREGNGRATCVDAEIQNATTAGESYCYIARATGIPGVGTGNSITAAFKLWPTDHIFQRGLDLAYGPVQAIVLSPGQQIRFKAYSADSVQSGFVYDGSLDRINAFINGTVVAYCDSTGWHNV